METSVLVVGESLMDIVVLPEGDASEHVGGSPANVAIGLARLGHVTTLATLFGADARGQRIRALLHSEDVMLAPGSGDGSRTSTALARLDFTGAATYEFDLDWQTDSRLRAEPGGHVHTGSIAATLEPGASAVVEIVRVSRGHATASYDPNARPTIMGNPHDVVGRIEELVELSDVVKASDEDVAWLYDGASARDAADRWLGFGPALVLITLGAQGVLVAVGGEVELVPARETAVADTVGAGDSFMSGVLSGLLDVGLLGGAAAREKLAVARLEDVLPAVQRALACAAITVSRPGADPPRRAELPVA